MDVSHSYALKLNCGSKVCKLITPEHMDHNNFKMKEDLIGPIRIFLKENGIKVNHTSVDSRQMVISDLLRKVPEVILNYDQKL